ncbi:MAG: F0F1 ATP synthase subunit epsilon [Candidatus Competibacteraceae bacterium]
MRTFELHLQGATQYERIESVTRFIGEDESGSFGIRAGHGRFMTTLSFGLARYQRDGEPWQYLALPGGLLYFLADQLFLSTRRYLCDSDYQRISQRLLQELVQEEEALRDIKHSLKQMEEAMLRRLWHLQKGGTGR